MGACFGGDQMIKLIMQVFFGWASGILIFPQMIVLEVFDPLISLKLSDEQFSLTLLEMVFPHWTAYF